MLGRRKYRKQINQPGSKPERDLYDWLMFGIGLAGIIAVAATIWIGRRDQISNGQDVRDAIGKMTAIADAMQNERPLLERQADAATNAADAASEMASAAKRQVAIQALESRSLTQTAHQALTQARALQAQLFLQSKSFLLNNRPTLIVEVRPAPIGNFPPVLGFINDRKVSVPLRVIIRNTGNLDATDFNVCARAIDTTYVIPQHSDFVCSPDSGANISPVRIRAGEVVIKDVTAFGIIAPVPEAAPKVAMSIIATVYVSYVSDVDASIKSIIKSFHVYRADSGGKPESLSRHPLSNNAFVPLIVPAPEWGDRSS